jgi:hypothetical protein
MVLINEKPNQGVRDTKKVGNRCSSGIRIHDNSIRATENSTRLKEETYFAQFERGR